MAEGDVTPPIVVVGQGRGPRVGAQLPMGGQEPIGEVRPPQPLDQPLTPAQMAARAADIQPGDVVPIPSNTIGSPRFSAA